MRSFDTFTRDLHELADWLQKCGVTTVAMESTGVYWIPLYQILERRGLQVFLVNAQQVKNVPGRKSDVSDCQWIQYLHSVGLLKASFRPPDEICVIRSLWRHRESLVQMAAEHIMAKAEEPRTLGKEKLLQVVAHELDGERPISAGVNLHAAGSGPRGVALRRRLPSDSVPGPTATHESGVSKHRARD